MGAVDHRLGPVQRTRGVQFGQQLFVQPLPHTRFMPVTKPSPAGHTGPVAQFLGQKLPGNTRVEHEQDAAQHLAVIQALAPRMVSLAGDHRQQRLNPLP